MEDGNVPLIKAELTSLAKDCHEKFPIKLFSHICISEVILFKKTPISTLSGLKDVKLKEMRVKI